MLYMLLFCLWMQDDAEFTVDESMTVRQAVVDVRVTDVRGNPVLGLKPEDFVLTHKGNEVPISSCVWVPLTGEQPEGEGLPNYPGQLFVLFFQVELDQSRVRGLNRKIVNTMGLLEHLGPNDRVAVVSFDSHLKIYQDFTGNANKVSNGLKKALQRRPAPYPKPTKFPSLAMYLDQNKGKKVTNPEQGLHLLADALAEFQGSKTLIYLSYGPADYWRGNFQLREDFPKALNALNKARVTVMGLDFAEQDYPTLDLAIRQFADDTGGFFIKTNNFAKVAAAKLHKTLSGYYILSHPMPEEDESLWRFKLKLAKGKKGKIMAKRPYNVWGDRMTQEDTPK